MSPFSRKKMYGGEMWVYAGGELVKSQLEVKPVH
jgi:hypothetical protein